MSSAGHLSQNVSEWDPHASPTKGSFSSDPKYPAARNLGFWVSCGRLLYWAEDFCWWCVMLSKYKERLGEYVLEVVTVGVGTGLSAFLVLAENEVAPYVVGLPPLVLVRVLASLILLLGCMAALVMLFRPRLRFDSRTGVFRDKRSGLCYCASCKAKKMRSPLKEGEAGWLCVVKDCKAFYPNPDYENPNRNSGRGRKMLSSGFVRGW